MRAPFSVGLSGPDNHALFVEVLEAFFADEGAPSEFFVDDAPVLFDRSTLASALARSRREVFVRWSGVGYLTTIRNTIVLFGRDTHDVQVDTTLALIEPLSFELASFGALYPNDWYHPFTGYAAPSFSDFHCAHGWACGFKGRGLERLVSPRWLDHGPWKQHLGRNGTRLIQFHDLDVDASTALAQARPAHLAMGISDTGGFLQRPYVHAHPSDGLYEGGVLKIIVHGRPIAPREMLDACAIVRDGSLGDHSGTGPVHEVRFIFMQEDQARQHLHALWLHGLSCYAIVRGLTTRLDDTYVPPSC